MERTVACLYSVVFTAKLLVNTRKPLVKQPVIRDSDRWILYSSNLLDHTRAREFRFLRVVRGLEGCSETSTL